MRKLTTLVLFLLSTLPAGCVPLIVGGGIGYVISREVLPNDVQQAEVEADVEDVWKVARETLEIMADPGEEVLVTSGLPRSAKASVESAEVTVTVEAFDIDRTRLRVEAKRALESDGKIAERVMSKLLDRIAGGSEQR